MDLSALSAQSARSALPPLCPLCPVCPLCPLYPLCPLCPLCPCVIVSPAFLAPPVSPVFHVLCLSCPLSESLSSWSLFYFHLEVILLQCEQTKVELTLDKLSLSSNCSAAGWGRGEAGGRVKEFSAVLEPLSHIKSLISKRQTMGTSPLFSSWPKV